MKDASAWERVKRLFDEALGASDRAAVLAGADPDVRAEVEELLRAHDRAPEEPVREGPGSTIGRYRLLQQIGEGGFGVVYMAEQTEPVSRKVALKVLKPGMDTGQVVARFEAERQALALMDHPNIARVFDAGTTASGRPYFVMELVRGVPVTEYCDEARLDTAARLDLFVAVCNAVQHAHQKGIIHRDLKPSNVLVTLHDGVPVPKVIDFGIAKALDRKLTEKTLFTEFRQMIGTPEYMAPEQAELSGLDIDTRADIYSLGVLLYELLTGTKPFDLSTLMERGYAEILRTIREVDPPRPSTRVSTMGEELTTVATKRHTHAGALQRLLRGDLDWIVMKALEKDRSRRYETANGLAMDIRRHLADEPVLATPPSAAYRLRKYARRHRVGVAAAAAIAFAVVAGATVAALGWAEAAAQRRRAESRALEARTEAARAKAVLDLVGEMLGSADPTRLKGRGYTVRQLLDDFDRGLGERLRGEPEVEATIRATMGRAYATLGVLDRAAIHTEAALEIRRRAPGEESEAFAESLVDSGRLAHLRGDLRAAEESLRRAVGIRTRRLGEEDPAVAEAMSALARPLTELNRLAEARDVAERAVAIVRRGLPAGDPRIADALEQLGSVGLRDGAYGESERCFREAAENWRRTAGGHHPRIPSTLGLLGAALAFQGDFAGADEQSRAALDLAREVYGDGHPTTAMAIASRAFSLAQQGDFAGSERHLREALGDTRRVLGNDHPLVGQMLDLLGNLRAQQGDFEEGEALARESLALGRAALGPAHPQVANSLQSLASILHGKGDLEGAEDCTRRSLAIRRESLGPDHPNVAHDLHNLAVLRADRGDDAGARDLAGEAEAEFRRAFGDAHPGVGSALSVKARALWALREFDAAAACATEALRILRAAYGDRHPEVSAALTNVAWVEWARGDLGAARRSLETALEIDVALFGEEHPGVAVRRTNVGSILRDLGDLDAAARSLDAALRVQERTVGPAHGDVARTLAALADVARDRRDPAEAESLFRRALAIEVAAHGEATQLAATLRGGIALAMEDAERFAEAEDSARRALETRRGEELLGVLGRCLLRRRDFAAAEAILRECLRARVAEIPGHWRRWEAQSLLGEALAEQGKLDEARPLLAEAAEKMKPPAPYADRRIAAEERVARYRDR